MLKTYNNISSLLLESPISYDVFTINKDIIIPNIITKLEFRRVTINSIDFEHKSKLENLTFFDVKLISDIVSLPNTIKHISLHGYMIRVINCNFDNLESIEALYGETCTSKDVDSYRKWMTLAYKKVK